MQRDRIASSKAPLDFDCTAQTDLEKLSQISTIEITVRYAETDQMGVVHHSVYPVYFEAGRTDFFSRYILPYSELERRGIWAPVIHFSCSLTGVAHYEDTLTIITAPETFTAARLSFSYRAVRKKSNEIIATGSSTHTFISPDRKIVRLNRHPELFSLITTVFPDKSIHPEEHPSCRNKLLCRTCVSEPL